MKLVLLTFFLCLNKLSIINGDPCKVTGKKMDCSNLNMVDCPDVNGNVTALIMDNNKLRDLKTTKCDKWKNLYIFSAKNNRLINLGNNILSSQLTELYAQYNELSHVYLTGEKLTTIDLTYNRINDISIDRLGSLNYMLLGNNVIDHSSLVKILYGNLLPRIIKLDLSYNRLRDVPISFMSFLPSFLHEVDLSGNQISVVYFTLFTYKSHRNLRLNFSQNEISVLNLNTPPSVEYVDLSHNKLSFIDLSSIKLLVTIPTIDFSYNPFNCSCKFLPPFVTYISQHSDSFIHRSTTNCSLTKGPNIFHPKCQSLARFYVLQNWKWIAPLSAVVCVAILLIGLFIVIRLRRIGYTEVGNSDHFSTVTQVSTILIDCTRSSNPIYDASFSQPVQANLDQRVGYDDKLLILCSSRDKKWVSKEIASYLSVNKEIVVSKMPQLPSSDFILMIIKDERSLKDSCLISNVSLALELLNTDRSEVRLLLRYIPSEHSLSKKTALNEYICDKIATESYFEFEDDYPLTCIESLKAWLNLEA